MQTEIGIWKMTPNVTPLTDGLHVFLMSTGAITVSSLAIVWYNKNKKTKDKLKIPAKVLSSPNASWKKVGRVSELFCYPLKSAKGKSIKECYFTEYGPTTVGGIRPLEDRMFIAFEEETKKFVGGRNHTKQLIVRLNFVAENRARLEADGMPPLEFDLPDSKSETVTFLLDQEYVSGKDCGSEANKWYSRYLLNSDSGIRLALRIPGKHRPVTTEALKDIAKFYPNMRDEDLGPYSDMASYMLLSKESVDDLNKRLDKPIPPVQLRPNILVEGCEPYTEDDWEWIKIGNQAIIRKFKLCTRCRVTLIDPDTGIPDPKYEPLKTLRSYRKLKDPVLNKAEGYAPAMGIYCGLYRSGTVHVDDDVYVYQDGEESSSCP